MQQAHYPGQLANRARVSVAPTSGAWAWDDMSVDRLHLSPNLSEFVGRDPAAGEASFAEAFAILSPPDRTELWNEMSARRDGGGDFSSEYPSRTQQSDTYWRITGEVRTHTDRPPSATGTLSVSRPEHAVERKLAVAREALDEVMSRGGVRLWEWPQLAGSQISFPGKSPVFGSGGDDEDLDDLDPHDPWRRYLHPDDRERFAAAIAKSLEAPGSFATEARLRLEPGGDYRWQLCRGSSTRRPDGNLQASGTLIDMEAHRAIEVEAKSVAERLQLVLQGARAGVWDWPDVRNEDYIEVHRDLSRLLGYEDVAMEQTLAWFMTRIHPDDHAAINAALDATFATGQNYEAQFRMRFKDGGYRWIRSSGGVILNAQGPGGHRLTGSIVDVHDRVVAERRLTEANVHLARFAQLVAHDLGAPLRHVRAFAEILDTDFGDRLGEEGRQHLKAISRAIEQSTDMIGDLLEYARTGTSEIDRQPIDLDALCREVRDGVSAGGRADHVTWEIGSLPTVHAGETQMRMLFQNLLANAVKFTSGQPDACISVQQGISTPEEHCVVVSDNGVGFDPAQAETIFEAFARAHSEHEFDGTGIGLANVARIVARHGGRVQARGEVGHGATFTVYLPR